MALERLFATWRAEYVNDLDAKTAPPDGHGSIFERLYQVDAPEVETGIIWRGERVFAMLNAYPYGSGHLMVLPNVAVPDLEALDPDTQIELWEGVRSAVVAVKAAYAPDGVNIGVNLGRGGGAGVPQHIHVHVLPRWIGDTNFMTSVFESRVLPEGLDISYRKLVAAWPHPPRAQVSDT